MKHMGLVDWGFVGCNCLTPGVFSGSEEGAVTQSVELATFGEKLLSSITPVAACSLLVGSVSV